MPQPSSSDPGELIAPSLGADFIDAYRERFFAVDPWTERSAALPIGTIWSARDRGETPQSHLAFVREWLVPQGLSPRPVLGAVLDRDDGRGASLLSVFRRRGASRARSAERLIDGELLAHVRRALRLHWRARAAQEDRDACVRALDRTPLATVLLDARGRVHSANRSAQRLLSKRDGLTIGRDGLQVSTPENTLLLRRAICDIVRDGQAAGSGVPLAIERPSGRRPLRALLAPLAAPQDGRRPAACAALFVTDPDAPVAPPCEMLRSFFGLTHAESALTRELSEGHSLAEAARRLGITYGTARQRLGQVFAKTQTKRQGELVHLVLTGPGNIVGET